VSLMPRLSPLTYTLSFVLLGYGLVMFVFGPCLTSIAETYGVPLGRMGLIFTFVSIGLLPSVVIAGFLSEVVGKKPLAIMAVGCMAAGCTLFAVAPGIGTKPNFGFALAAMVVIGIGAGAVESVVNALIADDNQPSPAFALNFSHAFFAVGPVIGPIVAGLLLRSQLPWQIVFWGAAGLLGMLFFALIAQPAPSRGTSPMTVGAAISLLRSTVLWLLLLVLAMYVGAEVGLSAWVSPLMEEILGANRSTAAMAVSVFWGAMILGRLVISALSTRMEPRPLILFLAAGSAVSSLGVAMAQTIPVCLAVTAVSGLFMSGMFGMVATHASRYFPERTGAVFGVLILGVGLGALVGPAMMGWVASEGGLRLALSIPPTLMAVAALAYAVPWSVREDVGERRWDEVSWKGTSDVEEKIGAGSDGGKR